MRPTLIVDFREHSLFALVLTAEGELVPCSQELGGVVTRALPADLLLDPTVTEGADLDWERAQEELLRGTGPGRARRLGLLRPWELTPGRQALVLKPPLAVLSSPAADDPTERRELVAAAAFLTGEQLSAVFRSAAQLGLSPQQLAAVAIIPAALARRAGLLLHKLFRQAGFRQLSLIRRETAAALATFPETSATGIVVLDLEDEALHGHHVRVETELHSVAVETISSRSVDVWGRTHFLERLTAALERAGRLPERTQFAALDRAFLGLCEGAYPAEVPTEPPLRLTHGLLSELFAGGLGEELTADLGRRLLPVLRDLNASAALVVGLGSALSTPAVEELVVGAAGCGQPAVVAQMPVRERAARGVASLLRWLAADPDRRFVLRESGGLRIDSLRGGSFELLPASAFPRPGERRVVRQALRLESDRETTPEPGQVLLNLLWGCNPDPRYDATLCTLALDITSPADEPFPLLDLELRVQRSHRGRLYGRASAALGGSRDMQRLRFAADGLAGERDAPLKIDHDPSPLFAALTSAQVEDPK